MRRTIVGTVLAVAGLMAGCALLAESPQDRAADDALDQAERVRDALGARGLTAAGDLGRAADELEGVEVMRAGGSRLDRNGVTLVIRVPGAAPTGWMSGQAVTVRRCFELRFRDRAGAASGPAGVPCPEGPALAFGAWPRRPEIPPPVYERLRRALPKVPRGDAVDMARVRRAVKALRLKPQIRAEIAAEGEIVGVSLQTGSGTSLDCLLARVAPGSTRVWSPARPRRTPGGAGCRVDAALRSH
ncbi:translation initiation factor IF-2 [Thermomonospora umbrina]|uniref:Translation initiation factor IF-2 n=1 Tax=Thermomonospora umbrina TaxID=111806 RepID=A0A3D9SIS0_9ACTN|nr:translation initiation factor IF-2 [Thermomonospora umbrina]REE95799.1 hypothetical protein DFJ69_1210 [Thermomonospora umbrina]